MKRNRRESSPDLDPNSISKTNEFKLPAPSIITKGRLAIVGLIVLSIVVALVFVKLPEKFQYALVAAVPAILVGAYIIISPFAGVWCFVFMDYLRPYTFIVALRPLRLGILTVAVTLVSWIVFQAARKHRIYWSSQCTWFLGYLLIVASRVLTAMNNFRAYQAS